MHKVCWPDISASRMVTSLSDVTSNLHKHTFFPHFILNWRLMMTSQYDVTQTDSRAEFFCTSTYVLVKYIYFSTINLYFLSSLFSNKLALSTLKFRQPCAKYMLHFLKTRNIRTCPLPPVTMLNTIKNKLNDDAITRNICHGQHCYGGEGGNMDFDRNFNENIFFFHFLQV